MFILSICASVLGQNELVDVSMNKRLMLVSCDSYMHYFHVNYAGEPSYGPAY